MNFLINYIVYFFMKIIVIFPLIHQEKNFDKTSEGGIYLELLQNIEITFFKISGVIEIKAEFLYSLI